MKMPRVHGMIVVLIAVLGFGTALSQGNDRLGLRVYGGVGYPFGNIYGSPTGAVYGGSLGYKILRGDNGYELSFNVLGGSLNESYEAYAPRDDGVFNSYKETSDFLAYGFFFNYLAKYSMENSGTYKVYGLGAGVVDVKWEYTSPGDSTVGEPLPGGGGIVTDEGKSLGFFLNLGLGKRFSEKFDARIEFPILLILDPAGQAPGIVPMISANAGYYF